MKTAATLLLNLCLSILWGYFAYLNLTRFFAGNDPTYLLFVISQTELVILFLLRARVADVSLSPVEHLTAFLGTFLVLLYRPLSVAALASESSGLLGPEFWILGSLLVYAAVFFEIFGAFWLGRSYGIVPANRGVKTSGLYKIVRHPIYLGSMLLYAGYACINPSPYNAAILLVACACQILRILAEERLLMRDETYVKYAERVRYRLVPGLF